MIKTIFYILSLLFLLLFNNRTETKQSSIILSSDMEALANEDNFHVLNAQLNNEETLLLQNVGLRFSNRVQIASEASGRTIAISSRLMESLLQKGKNILNKTSETLLTTFSFHYSSLRIRSGHWVYVLRKIII